MSHISFIRDSIAYPDRMSTATECRNLIGIQFLSTFSRRIVYSVLKVKAFKKINTLKNAFPTNYNAHPMILTLIELETLDFRYEFIYEL